jgi:predicted O-methyltransferase YrrM
MSRTFTVDWFTDNISNWSIVLNEFCGKEVSALEIGSFQGRSALWLLENVLTHEKSKITCVDTFKGSPPYTDGLDNDLFEIFKNNTRDFEDKITVLKGKSHILLRELRDKFDFIYIDGDHDTVPVLEDAILSFRLLKFGGIMIFDDYLWDGGKGEYCNPKKGIDAFLSAYKNQIVVLHKHYQVIIRKVSYLDVI